MANFDRAFIDQVLSSTDIVDVIKEKVNLTKNGANFKGLCPFHNEKTPSFNVSSSKQFYHCFGCGAHGDAIKFLQEHDNLTFIEALTKLAQELLNKEVIFKEDLETIFGKRKWDKAEKVTLNPSKTDEKVEVKEQALKNEEKPV